MKKPLKLVQWLSIETVGDVILDHNGKDYREHVIKLPYWVVKAYKLDKHRAMRVKVEILSQEVLPAPKNRIETNVRDYFRTNWLSKVNKMRKLNGGGIKVATIQKSRSLFDTAKGYNDYHKELAELNEKYGI